MFPEVRWNYKRWSETNSGPAANNPRKEALLKQSVELLRGERGNTSECQDVVSAALSTGFYNIAFEAIGCMSDHSEYWYFRSIDEVFEDASHWEHIPEDFALYCEKSVLEVVNDEDEARGTTLGNLGRYRFVTGNPKRAIELWTAFGEDEDVDSIISEMCDLIGEEEPDKIEIALSLAELIQTKRIKGKTLAKISKHL